MAGCRRPTMAWRAAAAVLALAATAHAQNVPAAPSPGPGLLPTTGLLTRQRTAKFETRYPAGSEDLPLEHPLVARVVKGNEPEQIRLTLGDRGAVVVSWSSGEPKLEVNGTTARSGPPAPNPGRGIVQYGPRPDGLKKFARGGPPSRYTQTYPDLRYTSGWWSHVLVDSLIPNERVYYRVGNDRDGWSQVSSFIAPPAAGTPTYPLKFTVIADVGQTYNTSVIVSRMEEAQPRAMLVLGDMAYADTYRTDGTPRLKTDPKKDYQPSYPPRWDTWGRLMAPLMSRVPVMAIPGNHEVEKDLNGAQFESYKMRFWHANHRGRTPSTSPLWYSTGVGPVHFTMLNAYQSWNEESEQLAWLRTDLANVDRDLTPWVVVGLHPPFYTSFSAHYREAECMRHAIEELLLKYNVDLVINGHVHGYERSSPVFDSDITREAARCAPTHITVGDSGNIDRAWTYVDGFNPNDPDNPLPDTCPGPNRADQCGRVQYSCPKEQPAWSLFRQPSYGFGVLEVLSPTEARWSWFTGKNSTPIAVDSVDLVQAKACLASPPPADPAGDAPGEFAGLSSPAAKAEAEAAVKSAQPMPVDGFGDPRAVDGVKGEPDQPVPAAQGADRRLMGGGL